MQEDLIKLLKLLNGQKKEKVVYHQKKKIFSIYLYFHYGPGHNKYVTLYTISWLGGHRRLEYFSFHTTLGTRKGLWWQQVRDRTVHWQERET